MVTVNILICQHFQSSNLRQLCFRELISVVIETLIVSDYSQNVWKPNSEKQSFSPLLILMTIK